MKGVAHRGGHGSETLEAPIPGSLGREWVVGWGLKGVDDFFSPRKPQGLRL